MRTGGAASGLAPAGLLLWLVAGCSASAGRPAGTEPSGRTARASPPSSPAAHLPPTPAEADGYLSFTSPSQVGEYLRTLQSAGTGLEVSELARTRVGQAAGDAGYPVYLASLKGERGQADRPSVLILAMQHGDEQSGKEAALALLRDLVAGKLPDVTAALDVYVVPLVNPWGAAHGVRENAAGIDLNRDHRDLRSPVTAALHEWFASHRPDVVIDVHETGPAAYDEQVALATAPNVDPRLERFAHFQMLPYMAFRLARQSLTYHDYVERYPGEGETYFGYATPDVTHARNSFALGGAISLLIEGASSRTIDGLEERTKAQRLALESLLEVIAGRAPDVRRLVLDSRSASPGDSVVLRYRLARDPSQPELVWRVRLDSVNLVTASTDRWRPKVEPTLSTPTPAGYLLSPGAEERARILRDHGFELGRTERPVTARVGAYAEADSSACRVEARTISVPAGSWVVSMQQPGWRLLATILDPCSEDAIPADGGTVYRLERADGALQEAAPTAGSANRQTR